MGEVFFCLKINGENPYISLGIYALVLFTVGYVLKILIDGAAYTAVNAAGIYGSIANLVNKALSVFSVLIGGFIIAYILDPAVDFVEKGLRLKKRNNAVRLLYLFIFIVLFAVVFVLYIRVRYFGSGISAQAMEHCRRLNAIYKKTENFVKGIDIEFVRKYFNSLVSAAVGWFSVISERLMKTVSSFGSIAATVILSIVVSYYFLVEKYLIIDKVSRYGRAFLPEKIYCSLKSLICDMDRVFSGYIRGQAADAVIMAVLISIGLAVLRVKFAVIIGVVSGFSNIIPYFGAITGFVLAVATALISGEPVKAVYAAVFLLILQQIDSVFIVPKIVGSNVRLSPAAVILVLAAAGKLFGLTGLILAVPVSAVIKVIIKRQYNKRMAKIMEKVPND